MRDTKLRIPAARVRTGTKLCLCHLQSAFPQPMNWIFVLPTPQCQSVNAPFCFFGVLKRLKKVHLMPVIQKSLFLSLSTGFPLSFFLIAQMKFIPGVTEIYRNRAHGRNCAPWRGAHGGALTDPSQRLERPHPPHPSGSATPGSHGHRMELLHGSAPELELCSSRPVPNALKLDCLSHLNICVLTVYSSNHLTESEGSQKFTANLKTASPTPSYTSASPISPTEKLSNNQTWDVHLPALHHFMPSPRLLVGVFPAVEVLVQVLLPQYSGLKPSAFKWSPEPLSPFPWNSPCLQHPIAVPSFLTQQST